MPYISQEQRQYLARGDRPQVSGELNYVLTKEILLYLEPDPSYSSFNSVIGVLECIKQELYRRMVAPYEDKHRDLNGDVFPPILSGVIHGIRQPFPPSHQSGCLCPNRGDCPDCALKGCIVI